MPTQILTERHGKMVFVTLKIVVEKLQTNGS